MTLFEPPRVESIGLKLAHATALAIFAAPVTRTNYILRTLPEYERQVKQAKKRSSKKPGSKKEEKEKHNTTTTLIIKSNMSAFKVVKTLYQEEGFRSLWRGTLPLGILYFGVVQITNHCTSIIMAKYCPRNEFLPTAHFSLGIPGYWSWLARWSLVNVCMEVLSSLVVHPISLLYTRYITDRPGYGCLHDPDSTSTPTGSSDKVPAAISRDINEHNHSATWSTSSSTYRGSYRYKNVCDLIRQSTALPPTSSSGSSSSAFHFLHKVRRLYRGWPLGILLTIIVEPIIQVTMDGFSYLQTMRILNGNSDEGYSMNQIWFAAACLGAQAALFYIGVYAVETVRHRVMVQEDEDEGDTMEVVDHEKGGNSSQALRQKTPATGLSFYWQTAKTIVDNEGWLTLWRGFLVEFLNYPISGVAYFVPVLLTKS